MKSPDLYSLFLALWADLHDARVWWQLAVIGAALGVAAAIHLLLRPRFAHPDEPQPFRVGGLLRVQVPLTALVVILAGRSALRGWHGSIEWLNLAIPLLTAAAIIRIVVYALRRVFAPGGGLHISERFVVWSVWLGVAVYILGLAPDLIGFLEEIGFNVGKHRVSLLLVIQATLTVGLSLLAALWLGSAIETRLMGEAGLDMGLRVMFSKLARAALVLLAILIALPAIGLDITALSVFGGALGVGLGLGLQRVVANYLSGFIILMDRSVSIGDVITIDRHSGEITKMTARYLVLRGLDGTEVIVPNETVISSPVVNQSYTDRRVCVAVPVRIGFRADPDHVARIMEDAARQHPRVLRQPEPKASIKQFGDNGLELELAVWIDDPQGGQGNLRSDLYREIWREFQAQGIEVPYPQREVRIIGAPPSP